jgi:hypothetical protein
MMLVGHGNSLLFICVRRVGEIIGALMVAHIKSAFFPPAASGARRAQRGKESV